MIKTDIIVKVIKVIESVFCESEKEPLNLHIKECKNKFTQIL